MEYRYRIIDPIKNLILDGIFELVGMARAGAAATLVPSRSLQARVPGSTVLWNWTDPLPALGARTPRRPRLS